MDDTQIPTVQQGSKVIPYWAEIDYGDILTENRDDRKYHDTRANFSIVEYLLGMQANTNNEEENTRELRK